MIRILFMIVAVVAAILAVILQQPLLFVAAGVSLAVTGVLMIVRLQRRRSGYRYASPSESSAESSDDLSSLGILEIRARRRDSDEPLDEEELQDAESEEAPGFGVPVESDAAATASTRGSDPAESRSHRSASGDPPSTGSDLPASRAEPDTRPPSESRSNGVRESGAQSTFTIKEKAQFVRASVDDSAPRQFRDVVVPYLQAFRAAVEANTVCLLKQADETTVYHIEAIVSLNAYARSSGTFSTKRPIIGRHDVRSAPEVRRVSDGTLSPNALGYYREAIAVKESAVAAVPHSSADARYILLADAMQEDTLDSERRLSLISHFARLLGSVLDKEAVGQVSQDSDEYVRPRREIIGDEMERARREQAPLALALVYLNRAEEVADRGEEEIVAAERVLFRRLRTSARDARVERFGELTFGVFFKVEGAAVESWAMDLQRDLTEDSGLLEGGVSIGIALLQDRHLDADSLRRDATDALREAYESGMCTIVE